MFDYPTLETLVPFILQRLRLGGETSASTAQAATHPVLSERSAQNPSVTTNDVAADLAAELKELAQGS